MGLKLIVFDLDGTLIDSIEDIAASLNHAIATVGLKPLNSSAVVSLVGEGVGKLVERAIGSGLLHKKESVLKTFLSHYETHMLDNTRAFDTVEETLSALSSFNMVVVSNKTEAMSKLVIDRLNMSKHFRYVFGHDSFAKCKPSPMPVLKAMELCGTTQSETIVVGDSSFDIEAGKRAGTKTVAAAYGYRSIETLTAADYIIKERLIELLPIVKFLS
ncbi:MAG: HAD-IA family hydrolase [Nitrospirae bacterium]|nr:HAD-IA family hydrolase [Nitrospirota bacterium]MBF0534937.1 HAD-IA family hydrolase [Nitrospirota bacterium]MBF0617212.1 HAD-IA family hydrolase [Nitrospirota bacterium]